MNIPILLSDLIQDFQNSREGNRKFLQQVEALTGKIKQSLTQRFFQTGISLFLELLLWIGVVACLGIIVFLEKLYPFSIIHHLESISLPDGLLPDDLNHLNWTLRLIILLLGCSFFWTAKMLSKSRQRMKSMNQQTNDLKELMQDLLHRQDQINSLVNKYPVDLGNRVKEDEPQHPNSLLSPDGDIPL